MQRAASLMLAVRTLTGDTTAAREMNNMGKNREMNE